MDALRAASQNLLVSQQKDIVLRLEAVYKQVNAVPQACWWSDATAPATITNVVAMICAKAMTQHCIPQPCLQAVHVLGAISRALATAATTAGDPTSLQCTIESLLEPFLYNTLHQSLKLLWLYGEDHPTLATAIENLFWSIYGDHPAARQAVRSALFHALGHYATSSTVEHHSMVANIVAILTPIVCGFRVPMAACHQDDVLGFMVPLLRSGKMVAQGSTTAVDYFVGPVTALIRVVLGKLDVDAASPFMAKVFRTILAGFHEGKLSSLAVLTAVTKLIEDLDGDAFEDVQDELVSVCARASTSDFPGVASKGLHLFRLDGFVALAKRQPGVVMEAMARSFARNGGDTHWDASVRREMLYVWDLLDAWQVVGEVDGPDHGSGMASASQTGAHASQFQRMVVELGFHGDAQAAARFRQALVAQVAHSTAQEAEVLQLRQARQNFACTIAAVQGASKTLHLVFGRTLGGGAFGSVKYAKLIERTVPQSLWYELAVKQVSKSMVREQECEDALKREMSIHSALTASSKGVGIVPLYHVFEDTKYYYLLTHYCRHGDLYDALLGNNNAHAMANGGLSATTDVEQPAGGASLLLKRHRPWVVTILRSVGQALAWIHSQRVFYGDVKPENILLLPSTTAQGGFAAAICDFGAAMTFDTAQSCTEFSGTLEYCAPELLQVLQSGQAPQRGFDFAACDAWSFGCLCVQLLTGALPFEGASSIETLMQLIAAHDDDAAVGGHPDVPPWVYRLLCAAPTRRASLASVLDDPWFGDTIAKAGGVVTPPPALLVGAAYVSRNSGRRESMMWKRVGIEELRIGGLTAGGGAILAEEEDGVVPVPYTPRDSTPSSQRAAAPSSDRAGVSQYYTVMPTGRSR